MLNLAEQILVGHRPDPAIDVGVDPNQFLPAFFRQADNNGFIAFIRACTPVVGAKLAVANRRFHRFVQVHEPAGVCMGSWN
ncbi:hypothetical protein GCM10009077_05200 [Roseibium denhamense]